MKLFWQITFAVLFLLGLLDAQTVAAAEGITPEELALVKRAEAARTDLIDEIDDTIVAIYGNDRQGGGSGFLFDPAGYVLTNHHVVAAAGSDGWAGLNDGKLYRWQLIGTDPGGDVAIIRLAGKSEFPAARLGLSDTVRVGDWVLALGNPFVLAEDQSPTVTLGIVSGVNRYQAGAGKNTLVYGNCIQIDSSVNPGNSGGPSFDMTGRVIGINGRISALERGRVNVGLGYAISMEQVRNFIPDLLATKVVQHGTLDAQFSTRGGQVVCSAINIDSPIARAGMKLGDRLLAFAGVPIDDVNVITNLLTIYPAGWPVEVKWDRGGREQSAFVRLTALPYDIQPAPQQPEGDKQPEGEKPDEAEKQPLDAAEEEKPDEAAPADGEKKQPSPERRRVVQVPRGLQLTTQGEIRDEKLNRAASALLVARARAALRPSSSDSAATALPPLEIHSELRQNDQAIGQQRLVLGEQRFLVSWAGRLGSEQYRFADGKFHRRTKADDASAKMEEVDAAEALAQPLVVQALALCTLYSAAESEPNNFKLTGGDTALGRRAYLLASEQGTATWQIWLNMYNAAGDADIRLAKAGLDRDAAATRPAVIFDDWRPTASVAWPHRQALVTGLQEAVQLEIATKSVAVSKQSWDQIEEAAR